MILIITTITIAISIISMAIIILERGRPRARRRPPPAPPGRAAGAARIPAGARRGAPAGGPSRPLPRRHQRCDFGEHDTSAPAELGGEIHNVSRNRARKQVPLQARKSHACGGGTFGAFWGGEGSRRPGGFATERRGFLTMGGRKSPSGGSLVALRTVGAQVRGG